VGSRKDFSNGPVWDPERERYFVEVRFPMAVAKKTLSSATRGSTLVESPDRENRGRHVEPTGSQERYLGCWANDQVEPSLRIAASGGFY
jgi:hypothetical protein